jgi:hypothetical protein
MLDDEARDGFGHVERDGFAVALAGVCFAAHDADGWFVGGADQAREFREAVLPLVCATEMGDDDRVEAALAPAFRDLRIARHAAETVAEEAVADTGILERGFEGAEIEVLQAAAGLVRTSTRISMAFARRTSINSGSSATLWPMV